MARAAPASPAPGEDPEPQSADKYINFRVSREDFIDVKTAALREDLTLGKYLMHTHRTYQATKG